MKKLFLTAAVIIVGLTACNKENQQFSEKPVTLSVTVQNGTKSTASTDENEGKVNSLQVFVFNGEALDGFGSSSNSTSATVTCTAGSREVWAVVNAPDLTSLTTKSALKAAKTQLADNSLTSFVMVGSATKTIATDTEIGVDVNRICSRVVIKKVTNSLRAGLSDKEFKLVAMYMVNVQGETDYQLNAYPADDGTWYNKMKYESAAAEVEALIDDKPTDPLATIAYEASYSTEHRFFVIPNSFSGTDVNGGTFSRRYTRLVLEATIDGATCYYAVSMPTMAANNSYEINELIITRQGEDDPDTPVTSGSATVTVTVKPWNTVLLGSNGTITI